MKAQSEFYTFGKAYKWNLDQIKTWKRLYSTICKVLKILIPVAHIGCAIYTVALTIPSISSKILKSPGLILLRLMPLFMSLRHWSLVIHS